MTTVSAHPSELAIERGGPSVDAHLATCERCQARQEAARAATRVFQQQVLPATLPLVRERLHRMRSRPRWLLWVGTPALAAVTLLFLVRTRHQTAGNEPGVTSPYLGTKGASTLFGGVMEIVVKRGSSVAPLAAGQKLRAGDALRFVYRGDRPRHLELRIVERGAPPSLFHPPQGIAPVVRPGQALPGSALVDDAPGAEELLLRIADVPFDTADPAAPASKHRLRIEKE